METDVITEELEVVKKSKALIWIIIVLVLISLIWLVVRPGIFVIQPIGALPDGVTFIYHSRNPEMPFISSPDGLCLEFQGSVTLLCRMGGITAGVELLDRKIIKLPYMRWMYLRSTGGAEFYE